MTNFIKEELEKWDAEFGYLLVRQKAKLYNDGKYSQGFEKDWDSAQKEIDRIKAFITASHLRLLERVVGIVDKITVTPQNKYDKEDLEKAQLINEYLLPAVKTKLINELKSIE